MIKNHILALVARFAAAFVLGASGAAYGQTTGFYGGLTMRDDASGAPGLKLGTLPSAWNRFATPLSDDSAQRASLFGGYRWNSDISLEAAFNTGDKYSLQPRLGGPGTAIGLATIDPAAHTWNADVYASWEFVRALSFYGRLGYAQTETRPLFAGASLAPGDVGRQRDGVNYGLGLRYDMTQSLGLRVEYSRFGRFSADGANVGANAGGVLPESDQVMIGVQFKF